LQSKFTNPHPRTYIFLSLTQKSKDTENSVGRPRTKVEKCTETEHTLIPN